MGACYQHLVGRDQGCCKTFYSAWEGPATNHHPAQNFNNAKCERPCVRPREAGPQQEERMGQRAAFLGKRFKATSTGSAIPLIHQHTEAGDRGEEKTKSLPPLPFNLKHTFLITHQKGLENRQFFFFLLLQGKTTQAQQKQNNLSDRSLGWLDLSPDKSQQGLQMWNPPIKPSHMLRITKAKNCEFH